MENPCLNPCRNMPSKRSINVNRFLGASCDYKKDYLKLILAKKPDRVTLHNGANDTSCYKAVEIVNNLLKLKSYILQKIPITDDMLTIKSIDQNCHEKYRL